ncbi:helix-turn-helix transcriptional regulator [Salmonella enterica]|uniref:helix-turn-helix transcriptional regulator n=1 Tax=Salmonella enterica TaxID=28901 RepID=UPI0009ACAFE9|nr:helix-turn-helix transcriptional regulator [Salmonella enterica]
MNTKMAVNDKEKLIFLVNACGYLRYGLASLMADIDSQFRIISVSHPEDMLVYPFRHYDRPLIMVFLPQEPRAAARGRVFLWRLEMLRLQKQFPVTLSCLLDGDRERWSVLLAGYRWLPCDGDMVNVRETLLDILNTPGSAVLPRVNLNRCRLSSRQQHILDETLAGRSVRDIAAHLEISERAVFSARAALIMKIGLNNRMELMSLAGDVSGCFKFL